MFSHELAGVTSVDVLLLFHTTEVSQDPIIFEITLTVQSDDGDTSGSHDVYMVLVVIAFSIATVTVNFTYTPTYPDAPPEMCVTSSNLANAQVVELEQLLREQVTLIWCVALIKYILGRGGGWCSDGFQPS